jgi:hypothetical protein
MKLFYTAISGPETIQGSPLLSLGGFKSSSPVPNSSFGSLFSDLSPYTIQKGLVGEYTGLILQNVLQVPVQNLKICIPKIEGGFCKYKLSVVELNSQQEMESIPSITSKPLYAEFYSAEIDNPIEILTVMPPQAQLGLWIERTLDFDSEELVKLTDCNHLFETKDKLRQTIEEVTLKIDFEYA